MPTARPPTPLETTPVAEADALEIGSAEVAFTGEDVKASVVPSMAGSWDDDDDDVVVVVAIDINLRAGKWVVLPPPGNDDGNRRDAAGLLLPDLDDFVFFVVDLFPSLRLPLSSMELPLEVWTMTSPVEAAGAAAVTGSTVMMEGCTVDEGDDDSAAAAVPGIIMPVGDDLLVGLTPATATTAP